MNAPEQNLKWHWVRWMSVVLVASMFLSSCVTYNEMGKVPTIQELAKTYSSLRTPDEKRAFCIHLIDEKFIQTGTKIEDLKTIIGKDFVELGKHGELNMALICFEEIQPFSQNKNINLPVTEYLIGWYLQVFYSDDGRICHYSLSNIHRTPECKF